MSYRFCLGASGAGKSTYLHKWLLEQAQDSMKELDSRKPSFILLVPEQYTMQAQKELIQQSAGGGIMNVEVLSFGRLAHRVFGEAGQERRAVLNDVGKGLVLRRVSGRCEGQLQILGGSIHRQGMLEEIKSVLSEFMQYGVSLQKIGEMEEHARKAGQGALSARLHDLRILQEAFLREEEKQFITSEERMALFAEAVGASSFLRGSVIVLDGFTGFTPLQLRVLASLIRTAQDVVISLAFGQDGGPGPSLVESRKDAGREQALFYLSRKTMRDLSGIAAEEGLSRGRDIWIDSAGEGGVKAFSGAGEGTGCAVRFHGNVPLTHLERRLFRYPLVSCDAPSEGKIRLFAATDPEEEVRQICIAIRRMVTEEGYLYRDIAVVTGDLDSYGEILERQGARYGIPVYLDRTSAVMLNPLTEAIRSALSIPASGYSYEAVFRYLRSGMSSLSQEETDVLENYCLQHGIRGKKKWLLPFDETCEPLRKKFLAEMAPLLGTQEELEKKAPVRTAAERTKALYAFLEGTRMEYRMEELAESFREQGDAVRHKQYSQLYRAVIALLEQIYLLLGEEKISAGDYREVLETGLSEIRLGTLPQQADRLLAGDIGRTRLPQVRVLFFAGVNDGIIPKSTGTGGLLSDLDREFLQEAGVELSPAPREQMYLQRLYLYLSMTKPTDRLVISYAERTADGRGLRPSYLIPMIKGLFPDLAEEYPQGRPAGEQLLGSRDSRSYLADALRRYADGYFSEDSEEGRSLRTVYGFLAGQGEDRKKLLQLKDAAFMRYDPGRIRLRTARDLYGTVISGSVSRMETAAQCTMRHFLRYGMRLRERDTFSFEAVDAGTILHRSIELFGERLRAEGRSWRDFSPEQGRKMARAAVEDVAAAYNNLLLFDTARSSWKMQRLIRVMERSVETLQYQILRGAFEPAAQEMSFGESADSDAIVLPLRGGRSLRLIGRIDRLDLARENDALYVKILDYKSGSHQLDQDRMRAGLQLQLMLYMNAALEKLRAQNPGTEVIPAAMLYYRMYDPVIKEDVPAQVLTDGASAQEHRERFLAKIRKELRPTGLVNTDRDTVDLLDRGLSGASDVIPVTLMGNGQPRSGSRIYTSDEYEELAESVRAAVCGLAEEILDGKAEASPVKTSRDSTACDYCPYKGACGFDPRIPGYSYRDL